MQDALIILNPGVAIEEVEQRVPVRQRYGERVMVVAADAASQLAGVEGVSVHMGKVNPPPDASESERIGVAAWNARLGFDTKERRGDGLSWDAPGFDAP